MKCIFCKNLSDNCVSIEHIIPESLGNKEHVLPKGVVCDTCNNYFAVKIEKPLLELPYFRSARFRNDIENKKGRPTLDKGIMGGIVSVGKDEHGLHIISENPTVAKGIIDGSIKHMILPYNSEPEINNINISKFLCKAALESLIYRVEPVQEWLDEITEHPQLDTIRNYVRYGSKPKFWEYHQRRIYQEGDEFFNENVSSETYEILHEFNFFYSDEGELFYVLVIMGIEFAVSLSSEEISGYRKWLVQNAGKAPLQIHDEMRVRSNPKDVNSWIGKNISFYAPEI